MSSKDAPYATLHDLPQYQEREKVGSAPWDKDQRPAQSTRAPPMDPHFFPSSQTAPFATSDNQPVLRQDPQPRRSRKLELHPPSTVGTEGMMVNESPNSGQKSASCQQNKIKTSTAPWDRDESHYSAKIRCGNSGRSAPFATEQKKK